MIQIPLGYGDWFLILSSLIINVLDETPFTFKNHSAFKKSNCSLFKIAKTKNSPLLLRAYQSPTHSVSSSWTRLAWNELQDDGPSLAESRMPHPREAKTNERAIGSSIWQCARPKATSTLTNCIPRAEPQWTPESGIRRFCDSCARPRAILAVPDKHIRCYSMALDSSQCKRRSGCAHGRRANGLVIHGGELGERTQWADQSRERPRRWNTTVARDQHLVAEDATKRVDIRPISLKAKLLMLAAKWVER